MKTLPTNVSSNYLKVGNSPRFFVHVSGSERKWGTAVITDYTNRLYRLQEIRESVEPFGGMGTVSGTNVEILKLGEEIKFYSSASILPREQGSAIGAGRILKSDTSSYTNARGAASGTNIIYTSVIVGQFYVPSPLTYGVFRAPLQFDIPAGVTSCEDAYINFTCENDVSDTNFSIYVVEGSWVTGHLDATSYSLFNGWQSGLTTYDGALLNESFSTATHLSTTTTNRIRLNRAGRQAIVDHTNSEVTDSPLKLMLLSSLDYNATAPALATRNQYVVFLVSYSVTPTLEIIYNSVKPDNERTRIYLGYDDESTGVPSSVSSMLNVWSGVVDSWNLDQRSLKLDLRHDDFKRNVQLKADVLNKTDFALLPDNNVGKPKPIIIGDFTTIQHVRGCASLVEGVNSNRWGGGDFVKGYVYDDTAATSRKVIFSSHELKEYGTFAAIYEGSLNAYTPISGSAATTSAGCVVVSVADGTKYPYDLTENTTGVTTLNPIVCIIPHVTFGSASAQYAVDSDYTNWAEFPESTDVDLDDFDTAEPWGANNQFSPVMIYFESSQAGGYTSTGIKLTILAHNENGNDIGVSPYLTTRNGQHYVRFTNVDANGISAIKEGITDIQLEFYKYPTSTRAFKYRNLAVLRGYSINTPDELYFKCKGLADDVSGTYTGVLTTQPVIENPSDIIRWFAMVKGGYTAAEMDASFTTARTDLSAWKYAFQWNEDSDFDSLFNYEGRKGIVNSLAEQCKSVVWEDYSGNLKIKVYDPTDGFPHSATDVPANLDIFEYSGSPSSESLTRHPVFSFNIDRFSIDETYNSFVLKYGKNYATGDFNSVLYINNGSGVQGSVTTNITSSNLALSTAFPTAATMIAELKYLTSSCYNEINATNELVFEAWAIRDEATATKLLQSLVEWYSRRRFFVELTTGMNAVCFELGDFINIRTDDIEDQFGTAFMECKKWKIVDMATDLVGCKIRIKAIEAEVY